MGKKPSEPKDSWDKFDIIARMLTPIISAIVVCVIGYFIKDSVDLALRQQELEISSAQGMKELIKTFEKDVVTAEEANAAALALAAFGKAAIPSLLVQLNSRKSYVGPAAEKALFVIGLAHPTYTCQYLEKALNNHNEQYTWMAHQSIVVLLGGIGCCNSAESLDNYSKFFIENTNESRYKYAKIIQGINPGHENFENFSKKVSKADSLLKKICP